MLTVAATAEKLGLKEPTVRKWIAERKMAHVKLGRSVRVPLSECERLIRNGTVPAREVR
jgi:excisionase family DNA binding protein